MPDVPDDKNNPPSSRNEPRLDWLASPDDDFSWDDDRESPPKPKNNPLARLTTPETAVAADTPLVDTTPTASPVTDSVLASEAAPATVQPAADNNVGAQFNAPSAVLEPAAADNNVGAQFNAPSATAADNNVGAQFTAPIAQPATTAPAFEAGANLQSEISNLQSPLHHRVRLTNSKADDAGPELASITAADTDPNLQSEINNLKSDEQLLPPPTAGRRLIQTREGWLLLALIVIAFLLRFNGLLYDNNGNGQPQLNHPDERFITGVAVRPHWDPGTPLSALFNADNSPITTRPGWQDYTYGSLPIYITRIAAEVATRVSGKPWSSYPDIALVGRFMSGLVDIGTMLLVFLIGRRLYSTRAGLFAAAIICFSVLNIQLAHFFATDSFVTFFFMLTIYFAVKYMQDGRWGSALWMGAGLGFAIASKFTIAPLALIIFAAFALRAIYVQRPQLLGAAFERLTIRPYAANANESPWNALGRVIPQLVGSLVASLVAFEIGEPYALFRLPQYFAKIGEQNNIMKGISDVPYTRQYIGTMPVVYQMGNLALWGLGIIMGAVVMVGLFFILFRYLFDLPGLIGLARSEGRRLGRMSGSQRGSYLLTRGLGAALIIGVLAVLVGISKPLLIAAGVFTDGSTGLLSNGYVVGALAGVALIVFFMLLACLRFTRPGEALLFIAALPYAALIFTLQAKWARYMLPLVPIFAIFTAGALWTAYRWARQRQAARAGAEPNRRSAFTVANGVRLVGAIAIVGGVLWALAFENGVYGGTPTFLQTQRWVEQNIPSTATVGTESWDEGIPGVGRGDPANNITFDMYNTDRPGSVAFQALNAWMNGGMDPLTNRPVAVGADYIVIASNRLYMTLPKLPWRYPTAIRYYQLLFSGQLGYQEVFEATRYPSLFGFTINDDHADETFTVYDHPKVMIFKKVRTLSDDELKTLFGNALTLPVTGGRVNTLAANNPGPGEKPVIADKTIMLDQPVGSLPVVQDYAWNSFASNNQWVAVALWLIVIYLLSFITLPLTWGIFRWLPDRGYAFSKVLSLVLVAFFAWLMSSLHLAMFDVWAILVSVIIVGLMSSYFLVRQRHEFLAWMRSHVKLIVAIEVMFLLAYFFQLWLRTFNPDLWGPSYGGERPMEFAFLNGVLRSPYMPPQDPLFAGGTINYYYYGYVLLAVLIKLTGIIPTLAFNLSMALIFALAFSVIASIVYNTVVFAQQRNRNRDTSVDYPRFSATGLRYGVLAGTLAMLVSNVFGGIQALFTISPGLYTWAHNQLVNMGVDPGRMAEGIQNGFNFWTTSRIIPGTITEFPFWSFLYGDLHPHLISIPVQVMALAFALNFAFDKGMGARWRRVATNAHTVQDSVANFFTRSGAQWSDSFAVGALRFLALTITVGSLAVINSWDFPTAIVVIFGGLLIPLLIRERVNGRLRALISYPSVWLGTGLLFGAIVGAALTLYLPFYINFKVLYSKIAFIIPGKSVVPGGDFTFQRTQLSEYLVIWGLFVLIAVAFLILRLRGVRFATEGAPIHTLRPSAVSGFVAGGFGGNGSGSDGDQPENTDSSPADGCREGMQGEQRLAPTEDDLAAQDLTQQSPAPVRGTMRIRASETHQVLSAGVPPSATIVAPTNGAEPTNGVYGIAPSNGIEQVNGIAPTNVVEPTNDIEPTNGVESSNSAYTPTAIGAQFIAPSTDAPDVLTEGEPLLATTDVTMPDQGEPRFGPTYYETKVEPLTQPSAPSHPRTVSGVGLSVALPGVVPWLLLALTIILAVIMYLPPFNERLLGFLSLIIGMAIVVTFGRRNDRAGLATGLFLLVALGITTGTELVYLADHLQGGDLYRMNTVFKFYEQAWIYFSLAGAMGLFYIFDGRDEALLPPLAESAAQAAVVGDDPQHLISSEDLAADEDITTTDILTSSEAAPAHPFMISEWGQNGLDEDPAAAPYPAPYTAAHSTNGNNPTTDEPLTSVWAQHGNSDTSNADTLASSNGHVAADTELTSVTAPVIVRRARITGPLSADATAEQPPMPFIASEWGQTGNDVTDQPAVASDYATGSNSSDPVVSTDQPAIISDYAASSNSSAPIVSTDQPTVASDYATSSNGSEPLPPTASLAPLDEAATMPPPQWHDDDTAASTAINNQPADDQPADVPTMTYAEARADEAMAAQGVEITAPPTAADEEKQAAALPLLTQPSALSTQRPEARGWWAQQIHPPAGGASAVFRFIFTPLFLILLLLSLGFNVFGTKDRLEQRFDKNPPLGTLNGMDWMKTASIGYKSGTIVFHYEYDAINWLLANVNGTPVVAQAPENYYREAGDFVAVFTGFPTIIGPQHEGEQRYSWQVDEHNRDADNLFNPNTDVAGTQLLMSKYDVQYIYVGQVERLKYNIAASQPNKFDDMVTAKQLTKVYSNAQVAIYHVVGKPQQQAGTDLKAGPRPSPTPRPTATPFPPGFDTKLDALRKKVADDPNNEQNLLDLAAYLKGKGDADGAIAQFQAAVKIKPDDVAAWQQMGDLLHSQGRDDDAIAAWKSATDNAPNSPDAWNKLGIAYRDFRQDYSSAADAFNKAVAVNAGFVEADYNLGLTLEKQGNTDGAKKAYQDCISNASSPDWKQRCQDRLSAFP